MNSGWKKSLSMLALLLSFSTAPLADPAGKPLAEKMQDVDIVLTSAVHGCDADIKEHCDGLGDNADKVFMCLAAYEEQLSTECKRGILEAAVAVQMSKLAIGYSIMACEADADKHCLDVQPGEGRLLKCIKSNQSKVSEQCITALKDTGLWELGEQ